MAEALAKEGCNVPGDGGEFARLVVEKPYGRDLESALDARRTRSTAPSTRTRSSGSTTTWARRRSRTSWPCASPTPSSSPSGTAATSSRSRSRWPRAWGSSTAGGFYETAGALRDIVQNHVMQVLALTLMEPPTGMDAEHIRDEKVKL